MKLKWYIIFVFVILAIVISIVGAFAGKPKQDNNQLQYNQIDTNIINQDVELPDDYNVGQRIEFTNDLKNRKIEENVGKLVKEINIDLDGNGKRENIILEAEMNLEEDKKELFQNNINLKEIIKDDENQKFSLKLKNGEKEYILYLTKDEINIYNETYFEIVDIDKQDNYKEILIYGKMLSDYCNYTLIRYDENGLSIIGNDGCDSIQINGDKQVKVGKRFSESYINGVYYIYKYENKKLNLEDGTINEKIVGANYNGNAKINPIENISNIEIKQEDQAKITEIYEKKWAKIKTSNGNEYWVYYVQLK